MLWLALKNFKEDMVFKDIMSPHVLLAPFALLMNAQVRELFCGIIIRGIHTPSIDPLLAPDH